MDAQTVLDFWFAPPSDPYHYKPRAEWFQGGAEFDDRVRTALAGLHMAALSPGLDPWGDDPDGNMAMILLLDQVPRHLFRGTARMYATDAKARAMTYAAYGRGFDRNQPPVRRWFIYMPLMHSEDLDDQERSLALFDQLRDDLDSRAALNAAAQHHAVIRRFGRFPHRNAILGRPSTPEELEYLAEPGALNQ